MSQRPVSSDLYAVLEVCASADAAQIKDAYRQLVRRHHPDANPARREECEARMKQIIEAYAVLGNEEKRRVYDYERQFAPQSTDTKAPRNPDEPTNLMGKVRFALEMPPREFAARMGLPDESLSQYESRDAIPTSPVQLRTFIHFCDQAVQRLEADGQFARADEIRVALSRKRNQRRIYG